MASLSNPYASLAAAQKALREIGKDEEAQQMQREVFAAPSTQEMEQVIRRHLEAAQAEQDAAFGRLVADVLGHRPSSPPIFPREPTPIDSPR